MACYLIHLIFPYLYVFSVRANKSPDKENLGQFDVL